MSRLEELWWRSEEPGGAEPAESGSVGGLLRALLAPLAAAEAAFRAGAALRGALYRSGLLRAYQAAAPVISIGNLAVGGSGKTPAALAVARRLQLRGRTVAVLSRGYGASRSDARQVSAGRGLLLPASEAGDEPALLARRLAGLHVWCGPRRAELAELAVAGGADALVLDDGFQHRALARDLDLVVLDAANPAGNGHLLPRGPNREPFAALGRAGLAWLSRVDQAERADPRRLDRLRAQVERATGRRPIESRHAVTGILDGALERDFDRESLRGRRVLLLAGIGRPGGFRRTVEGLGAQVVEARLFRDHHWFTEAELAELFAAARAAGCDQVVTTEKDAARLPERWRREEPLRVVRIDAEITAGDAELEAAIAAAIGAGRGERR